MTPDAMYTAMRVIDHVSTRYSVPLRALGTKSRLASIAWPRMIAIYVIRHLTGVQHAALESLFRGTGCSAQYAIHAVQNRYTCDNKFALEVTAIINACRPRNPSALVSTPFLHNMSNHRVTISQKHNGRYYISLRKLEADELYRIARRMPCGEDPGAFLARYRASEALEKLAAILRSDIRPCDP